MYILHNTESRNTKIVDNNLCFGELSFHSFMNLRIQVSENIQDGSHIKNTHLFKNRKMPNFSSDSQNYTWSSRTKNIDSYEFTV